MGSVRGVRYALLSVWAIALTGLTYVLGATPLKLLRGEVGRTAYLIIGAIVTALFMLGPAPANQLGLAFLSLMILIGIFAEFEDLGLSLPSAAFFALVINGLMAAGAFALWVFWVGRGAWRTILLGTMERALKPVSELNPALHFDLETLAMQLPSILIIAWLTALFAAVMLENRFGGRGYFRAQLAEYRNPDAVTWALIVSLLGAFGRMAPKSVEIVANNTLNVCFCLFFIQGIAVVRRFLGGMRLSPLVQTGLMVIVVLNFFWFVSVVGLVDHWVDFRARLSKRSPAL